MKKRRVGKIVSWKPEQGYGFIHPLKGGSDLFLHINDVRDRIEPKIDEMFSFVIESDKKGNPIAAFAHPHHPHIWQIASLIGLIITVITPFALSICIIENRIFPILCYSLMSIVTFLMQREDKRRADNQLWRIPDDSMHLAELMGGWPGSLIAQRKYHLKARKKVYQGSLRFIIFLHALGWIDYLILNSLILKIIIKVLTNIAAE